MYKIYVCLIISAAILPGKSFCQTVNGTPLKDLNLAYIQIVAKEKVLSAKYNFTIDIGIPKQSGNQDNTVRDSTGKEIIFGNLVDALNYLDARGYDFMQTYSMPGNDNYVYYLMKKRDGYYQDF